MEWWVWLLRLRAEQALWALQHPYDAATWLLGISTMALGVLLLIYSLIRWAQQRREHANDESL